ncbi:MAG: hypothetical protein ACD_48C00086G0004 [uncultured bacterium]|nr:MAG: hypothetical protein ACD_48C00086G0004 [uncultured bacterium]
MAIATPKRAHNVYATLEASNTSIKTAFTKSPTIPAKSPITNACSKGESVFMYLLNR